ncbi:glucoside xylosyltransferase 1-like [Ixodes scapularis]
MQTVKIWRRWSLSALLIIGCLAVLGSLWYTRTPSAGYQVSDGISTTIPPRADGPTKYRGPVTMVAVTCADGLELTMTSLKSAAAFSRAPLKLILYADVENIKLLQDRVTTQHHLDYFKSSAVSRDVIDVTEVNLWRGPVTMVAVTCADGLELTMTSLKSAAAFSRAPLKLILYADVENIKLLQDRASVESVIASGRASASKRFKASALFFRTFAGSRCVVGQIMQWPESVLARITYDLRLVMFPKKDFDKWKHFFAPCSSQRLFLPDMLLNEDAVLYVDADTLFLGPVEDLWDVFDKMNKSQMMALSYEAEDPRTNWYQQHAKHPYVPPFGVNAGVMPMNLTRMREFDWVSHMEALLKEYEGRIPWVDQDLVNILFSAHPDKLFLMTCRWNYRQDNCQFHASCLGQTPALLHANRRCFLVPDRAPAYTAFHTVMRKYELGTSLERNFIDPLERELHRVRRNECVVQFLLHSKQWRTLARQLDYERGYNDDSSDERTS